LGKVYHGKVLNIVDFGCFVQLDMFRQSQGLVHISQLRQKGRVTSVSDVVSRGDKVMVSNYHLATRILCLKNRIAKLLVIEFYR